MSVLAEKVALGIGLRNNFLKKNYSKAFLWNSRNILIKSSIPSVASISQVCNKKRLQCSPSLNYQIQNCQISNSAVKNTASYKDHDHVNHWTAERVLAVVMLGSFPAVAIIPSPALEYFVALCLSLHIHWGIEAVVLDYVRPSIFGTVIPKVSLAAVYVLSAMTLGGLFYFIYTDVGLVNAVKLLWKL